RAGSGDAADLGGSAAPAAPTLVDGGPMNEHLHVRARVVRDDFLLDVELEVRAGEVVALLGPNGAGKTTLVRALAGLEPSVGTIRIGDEELPTDVEQRRVGVVFSDLRLFPHLSVRDNVGFGARDPELWLDRLDLQQLADRKPGQLSGGQAQRVA